MAKNNKKEEISEREINLEQIMLKISNFDKDSIVSKIELSNIINFFDYKLLKNTTYDINIFTISDMKIEKEKLKKEINKFNDDQKNEIAIQLSKLIKSAERKEEEIKNFKVTDLEKRFSKYLVNALNEFSYLNKTNTSITKNNKEINEKKATIFSKRMLKEISNNTKIKTQDLLKKIEKNRVEHLKNFESILKDKSNSESKYFELLNIVVSLYEFLKSKYIINLEQGQATETLLMIIKKMLFYKIKILANKDDLRNSEIRFIILEAWRLETLSSRRLEIKNKPYFYLYVSSFFGVDDFKNILSTFEKMNYLLNKEKSIISLDINNKKESYFNIESQLEGEIEELLQKASNEVINGLTLDLIINSIDHYDTASDNQASPEDYFVFEEGIKDLLVRLYYTNKPGFDEALNFVSSLIEEKNNFDNEKYDFFEKFSRIKENFENEFEVIHKDIKKILFHKTPIEIYDLKLTKEILSNNYFNTVLQNKSNFLDSHEKKFFADFKSIIEPLTNKSIKNNLQQKNLFLTVLSKIKDLEIKILKEPTYVYFYYVLNYLQILEMNINRDIKKINLKNFLNLKIDLSIEKKEITKEMNLVIKINKEGNLIASEVEIEFDRNYFSIIINELEESSLKIGTIDDQNTRLYELKLKLNDLGLSKKDGFELKGIVYYASDSGESRLDSKSFEYFVDVSESNCKMVRRVADNPYTQLKGTVVHKREYLFGREGIMKDLNSTLFENENKEAFKSGNLIAIHGQTRAGKSSILKYFEETVAETGYVSIVHIQSIDSLYRQDGDDDFRKKAFRELCKRIIEKVKTTLSRSENQEFLKYDRNLNLNNNLYRDPEILTDLKKSKNDPTEIFKTFIDDINYYSNNRFRLLLIIDEFTLLKMGVEKKKIYNGFLNDVSDLTRGPSISIIFSGHEHTEDIIRNPEYIVKAKSNPVEYKEVKYLSEGATRELVTLPLLKSGSYILDQSKDKEAIVNRIFSDTAGSPYLINLIMYRLIDHFNSKESYKSDYLTELDLSEVMDKIVNNKFESKIDEYFEKIIADEYYQIIETSKNKVKSEFFKKSIDLKEYHGKKNYFDTFNINSSVIKKVKKLSLNQTTIEYLEAYQKFDIDFNKVLDSLKKRNIIDDDNKFIIKLFERILKQREIKN
jgi:hypothetical protein